MDKHLFPVALGGGIDTKTDPRQVIPGKLLDLQNGIFQQTGAINRRWGYTALGTGIIGGLSKITKCAAIEGSFNNELILYDGTYGYSYIAANNAWANRGEVVSVIQTNQQIIRNSSQQLSPDSATLGGIQVYAWEDSRGGIRYSIVDQASGAFIVVDQPLFAGMPSALYRPKVIPLPNAGGIIAIFYVTADGSFGYVGINPSNPTATPNPVILISSQGASGPGIGVFYDVAGAPNGNVYILFQVLTGGQFGKYYWSRAAYVGNQLVSQSAQSIPVVVGNVTPGCLDVVVDASGNIWLTVAVSYFGAQTYVTILNSAETVLFSEQQVISSPPFGTPTAVTLIVLNGVGYFFMEHPSSGTFGNYIYTNTMTIGGVLGSPISSTSPVFIRGCGLASKAFQYGGKVYLNVATQSQQQSTYFTLDQTGNVVAKANPNVGGGYVSSSDYVLPECQQISTGIFQYANLVKGIVNTEAGGVLSLLGVNKTKLDFLDSNQYLSSNLNGEMYVVGGILQRYDGAQFTEVGFHQYPEAVVYTPVLSGGSMADGTYGYAVTYEWVDNLGNNEPSAPSIVNFVTIAGGGGAGSVQIQVPTLRLTKKANVKIVVYRTVGAATPTGSILYRVTSALVPLYNNPLVDTVTFTDTLADTSITSNGAMYTQPLTVGANPVLPNAAPPACAYITTFANRIVVSGADLTNTLWVSQAAIAGAPAQFCNALQLLVDPDGGPITSVARMDDKLLIFKQTGIFYMTFQGPTATGDQSDFGVPIQIPSGDVGCASNNSIVLTPQGLLFQSLNGIYKLDRGLNLSYIGAPVEQYTLPQALNLAISSATLLPNQWVVFTTAGGIALVYDYLYDQWSTFTNHTAIDSDLWLGGQNLFVWANGSTGVIYKQTPGAYLDNGAPIPVSLTTSWLTFGGLSGANSGLQNYQRVYHAFLVGQYYSPHTLQVNVAYDYDTVWTGQVVVPMFSATSSLPSTALGLSTFGSASPFGSDSPFGGSYAGQTQYQYRVDTLRKCQAIAIQIQDNGSAAGQGFSLSSLGLVVGVKQGGNKLPASRQFGAT